MRGQYFSFDAIVAAVIMAIATTSLVAYWYGVQAVVDAQSSPLQVDAMRIAESLLSKGVPSEWPQRGLSGTFQIGIGNGFANELNQSKIARLREWANPSSPGTYASVGRILRAPGQYYIEIEQVGCPGEGCGPLGTPPIMIGNSSFALSSEVAVAYRGATLDGKPVRIRVFLGR